MKQLLLQQYIQLLTEYTIFPNEIVSIIIDYTLGEDMILTIATRLARDILYSIPIQIYRAISATREWDCINYHSNSFDETLSYEVSTIMYAICMIDYHYSTSIRIKKECNALYPTYSDGWKMSCNELITRASVIIQTYHSKIFS
jgi:hypothetical protein